CCRVDEREHDLERCQKDYFRGEDLRSVSRLRVQSCLHGRRPKFPPEFQCPMRPDEIVQLGNEITISVKHARCAIRGIHGAAVACLLTHQSNGTAACSFIAMLKRHWARAPWKSRRGCSIHCGSRSVSAISAI